MTNKNKNDIIKSSKKHKTQKRKVKKVNKMTKREMFNLLLTFEDVKANQELVDSLNHELELLDKKSRAERKPTPNQVQNEILKTAIVNYLTEVETAKAVKDLIAEVPELAGLSTPKVTALVTALYNKGEGVLIRETIKKVNYYSVAGE